jgi:aconitate hydratase
VARRRRLRSGLHRHARTRLARRAVDGRPEASRRPRRARKGRAGFNAALDTVYKKPGQRPRYAVEGTDFDLGHGDVAIAAITSCTNTSNPSVLIAAGLLARNARRQGPEVQALGQDLAGAGIAGRHRISRQGRPAEDLDKLGFNLVGFGCTTCIGNSGPLPAPISKAINDKGLIAPRRLSGNRNFEGRVSPDVQANYLASPPLVVAYALAGTVQRT